VHQLLQRPNGELYVDMPSSIGKVFARPLPLDIKPALGKCEVAADSVTITTPQSFGIATIAPLPAQCKVSMTIAFERGCQSFGLMLKLLDDLDTCYYFRFEPARNRMVLDRWPRPGDVPFVTDFERPLKLIPKEEIEVQVIVDGTIAEVYVSEKIAMSTRLYSQKLGMLGVFTDEGVVSFRKLGIFSMNQKLVTTHGETSE
jgi:beta-fructofuranosidase